MLMIMTKNLLFKRRRRHLLKNHRRFVQKKLSLGHKSSIVNKLSKTTPHSPVKDKKLYPKNFNVVRTGNLIPIGIKVMSGWSTSKNLTPAFISHASHVFYPSSADACFTTEGFDNWKSALAKKGWVQHHGKEFNKRNETNSTTEIMVVDKLPEHQAWLELVFHVVKYLTMNGLSFRGDKENTDFTSDDFAGGLYLNPFAHLFKINPDLKKIAGKLSANAKYSSPDIQNEVIQVLRRILKNKLSTELEESEVFTVMVDGSTDKNRRGIVGIAVRKVTASGEMAEHALDLKHAEDRSAKGLLEILLQSLKEEGIDLRGIAAQCYDGANVLSGEHGGMHKILSDYCNRIINYIHYFCHRLKLVDKDIISFVPFVADHFSVTS